MHAYGTKKCPVKQEGWCPKANSEHVIVDKWLSVHQVLQIPCMLETSSNDCLALSLMLTVNTLFCLSILHVPQRVDPHPSTSTPFTPPPAPSPLPCLTCLQWLCYAGCHACVSGSTAQRTTHSMRVLHCLG